MSCAAKQVASARVAQVLLRPRSTLNPSSSSSRRQQQLASHKPLYSSASFHRHASSNSSSPSPPKPIVLEKPDKFRPPSHASRPNARSTTSTYGGGAAFNQGMSEKERARSQQRSYPNSFPNQGTTMHWFLTTTWVHVSISLAVLSAFGLTSAILTWSKTSPYAHLIPPLNMLFFSPFTYMSEVFSVWRLHQEYMTQQTAEHRRQNILDAQKRRLYRRAHGMEDLDADEVSGVDVRGLVEWDDGLTKPQRERGGQYNPEMIGARMQEMGQRPGENLTELMARKRIEEVETKARRQEERARKIQEAEMAEEERLIRIGARKPEEERPRRKIWFGIWG